LSALVILYFVLALVRLMKGASPVDDGKRDLEKTPDSEVAGRKKGRGVRHVHETNAP
jgi:hypothetical protein